MLDIPFTLFGLTISRIKMIPKKFVPPLLKRRTESEESLAKKPKLGENDSGQRDALKQISIPNSNVAPKSEEANGLDGYYLVLW